MLISHILYLEKTLEFIYSMSLQITVLVTLDIEVFPGGRDKGENVLLQKLNFSASCHFSLLNFTEKEIAT